MAEYRIRFTADSSAADRSISSLKKAIAAVTKEFEKAEIGADDFIEAASDLSKLKKELNDARSAVVNVDKAYQSLNKAIDANFAAAAKAGKAAEDYNRKLLGLAQEQLQAEDQARRKNFQAEVDDWDRRFKLAVAQSKKIAAQQRAIMEFRAGMGARGAIPAVASPIRGGADQFGSPAYFDAVSNSLQQAIKEAKQISPPPEAFAPVSLAAYEAKLVKLKREARLIEPETTKWKELTKEILKTEKSIENINRRQRLGPSGRQRLGAAGGAFLYGGGMGGGVGSALGGVAGGLIAGVPGAFAGAAFGQMADSIGTALSDVTAGAAAVAQLQRGLALASIDAKDFSEAQDAIRQSSDRLVVPIEQVYRQFTQLRVNTKQYGLTVKDTQQILEGVVLAVSATGGSLEDVDGAMRAVIQIFSKGSVQAEELRGQLGERFPGAVVKFAQANKLSFAELQAALEQGQVTVADFVNFAKKNYEDYAKFTEQLGSAPEFAGRRLEKAMNDMQVAVGAALGPAGALIQDFATQGIKDITAFVRQNKDLLTEMAQDFASVFSAIVSTASEAGQLIVKVLGPAFNYIGGVIRQLKVMTGVAGAGAARAEMDAAFALMQKHGPGRARFQRGEIGFAADAIEYNKAAERYARAEKQFKAAGGSAALPSAQATKGLTFGGPGAGIDLNQVTGGKKAKDKANKELKDYTSDRVDILRREMAAKIAAIDADENIFARERELQAARVKLQYEGLILQEQARLAQQEALKFSVGSRALFLQERKAEFDQEALRVQSEYAKVVKGPLLSALEQYNNALEDESRKLELAALGRDRLTHVEEAESLIRDALAKATDDERKMAEGLIATLRNLALARESAFSGQYLVNIQNALRDTRELALAPIGMEGLLARRQELRRQGIGEGQAQALFDYEQETQKIGRLKEGFAGLASEVNAGFGTAITNIATDFENLQQHGLNFIQTLANAFKQLANTIIQEMTRAMINKAVSSLFSFVMPGTPAGPGANFEMPNSAFVPTGGFKFANGGLVTGPTLGLIGEGRFNEAVVPLPNGKSIPVDLGGAAGSNISTNIVVNMNNGQASSQMTGNGGQALGRELEGAVRSVLLKESRPGGIIYSQR